MHMSVWNINICNIEYQHGIYLYLNLTTMIHAIWQHVHTTTWLGYMSSYRSHILYIIYRYILIYIIHKHKHYIYRYTHHRNKCGHESRATDIWINAIIYIVYYVCIMYTYSSSSTNYTTLNARIYKYIIIQVINSTSVLLNYKLQTIMHKPCAFDPTCTWTL